MSVNAATRVVTIEAPRWVEFGACFIRAYRSFASACRGVAAPGVAVVAIGAETGALAGVHVVHGHRSRHTSITVGRHTCCDLHLAGDDALALRQLTVIVSPLDVTGGKVTFRALDLRSVGGMQDESGRTLRGLRADGAAGVRCGGYVIFVLPVGPGTSWPEAGAAAWAALPPRAYVEELPRVPEASVVRAPAPIYFGGGTSVTRTAGPYTSEVVMAPRDVAGHLWLRGPGVERTIAIGHEVLRAGLLVGRYARCQHGRCDDDRSLSRVHALVMLVDERIIVVDTGSTNALYLGEDEVKVAELVGAGQVGLGCTTALWWRWAS
jgi:hypothetical protein